MANVNAPFGLKPIGKLGSAVNSTGTTEYDILTGTTGTIYTGDPVKMVNTGGIAVAAAGDLLLGVFQGCHYTDSNGDKIFSPVWTTWTVTATAKQPLSTTQMLYLKYNQLLQVALLKPTLV